MKDGDGPVDSGTELRAAANRNFGFGYINMNQTTKDVSELQIQWCQTSSTALRMQRMVFTDVVPTGSYRS